MEYKRVSGGTMKWYGKGQIIKGDFHATTAGFGLQVKSSRTWIERGNADDGGKALAVDQAYLFGSRRLLLTYAQSGNISAFGGCDRLSIAADESRVTAEMAAHWAFLEFKTGGIAGNAAGAGCYRADLKLISGATIPSGGVISAFLAAAESLAGTHTGRAVVIHVPNPQAGTYDALLELGSTTGCNVETFTGNSAFVPNSKGTFTQTGQLLIYVNGNARYIPYGTVE